MLSGVCVVFDSDLQKTLRVCGRICVIYAYEVAVMPAHACFDASLAASQVKNDAN
jgi:hypothetical protein